MKALMKSKGMRAVCCRKESGPTADAAPVAAGKAAGKAALCAWKAALSTTTVGGCIRTIQLSEN